RSAMSYDLEAHVADLAAVIDRSGADRVDLFAGQHSGPPAIAYAVQHPDRVAHLVLFCSYADGRAYSAQPVISATRPIIHQDWDFYTEAVARLLLGWTEPEAASRFAKLINECTTPEAASAVLAATSEFDVTALLEQVAVPTLVIYRPQLRAASFEQARLLAAAIPGARMVLLEGDSVAPYLGDVTATAAELDAFLTDAASSGVASPPSAGSLQTVLFTDIAGSTLLTERLGDEAARRVLRQHEQIVRDALRRHGGVEIKAMGDGFMASFGLAVAAVECAIGLQRTLAEHNAAEAEPVRIRIGMNAGEPIAEDGDLFGTAVIAAARIGAAAGVGEIHVSDVVRQLVAGKGFRFTDLGEVTLRGFDAPVRVHSVEWAER
ncbi:MAG TPA: adenylate/guanylate cyclase domain-containing protein, partial [Acidimicrobiia bacterium]|nr:adenylate/guanylate cyclase domain-containing protein [Acidimicrobiia bacterium]